jgi:hypothetical protein
MWTPRLGYLSSEKKSSAYVATEAVTLFSLTLTNHISTLKINFIKG